MPIKLNCDLGEGCPFDADLMSRIDYANICCGFHAGDARTTRTALVLAKQHNVVVGAHPGYADREHFGRRELTLSPDQLRAELIFQIGGLREMARDVGVVLRYIKLHGALYNQANRDAELAGRIAEIAQIVCLSVMGLPGSALEIACASVGYLREGFADRRYRADGSLVPRSEPDAFVHDPVEAITQARWLIETRGIDTLCVHGDNPEALAFVAKLREGLR